MHVHTGEQQPTTIELRRRLTIMNAALFARGVVGGGVGGDPPSESWYEVSERISADQLAALGKDNANSIPIVWYPLSRFSEEAIEEMLRAATDPEYLVEQWCDRLEQWHHDEPPPGQSSTRIYFMGAGEMTAADVGAAIVEAANAAGLDVDWNGDPERVVDVRLGRFASSNDRNVL